MRKILYIPFVVAFLLFLSYAYPQAPDPKYFNEVPPGATPKRFAVGKVSTDLEFEFGSVFSTDMKEFYYGVVVDGKAETRVRKFENGSWSPSVRFLFHDVYSFNDPFLSPDNKKLFFISDRPLTGSGPKKDYDIWYVERQGGGWSEPRNAGPHVNSGKNEYYISFTESGKLYFSSNKQDDAGINNYDIYSCVIKDGEFLAATKLPASVNTDSYEADVFVAPDESYVVFAANRPGGLGSGDLYVSRRKADGTWTPSRSLGSVINTETDDFCPYVSPDGKYLFYASRGDIYWVSVDVLRRLD
jgi:hypothetical protein